MSSASVWTFVTIFCLYLASSEAWLFGNERTWSEQKPSSCPHENPNTHVCTSIHERKFTCVKIGCCRDFHSSDGTLHHGEFSASSDVDDEDNVHFTGPDSMDEDDCPNERVCFTVNSCTLYSCSSHCCSGYTKDWLGECEPNEGSIDCENDGTSYKENGVWKCRCQPEYKGEHCEIPICDCENGAQCMVTPNGMPYCKCANGYSGKRCETPVCSPGCENGGTCVKDGIKQYCSCTRGFVGQYCEKPFESSEHCPVSEYNYVNGEMCYSDSECSDDQVCCQEGQTTLCRDRVKRQCTYDGREYNLADTVTSHKNGQCEMCTCVINGRMYCMNVTCPRTSCDNPTLTEGECCPHCPNQNSTGSPSISCPSGIVHVATDANSSYVTLTSRNAQIYDRYGSPIRVQFKPERIEHCKCSSSKTDVTDVQAIITYAYGTIVTCSVRVTIQDTQPPVFTSCPDDMYIFDDEEPQWQSPVFWDNVGIRYRQNPREETRLDAGTYSKQYRIFDYDGNMASCVFKVVVSSRDTPFEELPQRMADRATGEKSNLTVILVPTFIGLLVLGLILLGAFCLVRRHRSRGAAEGPNGWNFANVLYSVNTNQKLKTPVDCKAGVPDFDEPPAYNTICGNGVTHGNDVMTYTRDPPPAYGNPEYDALPEKVVIKMTKEDSDTKA